jgi:hypothetical protein
VTDIDKMEAGPEMDALVATEVMGWVKPERGKFWKDPYGNRTGWWQWGAALLGGPVFRPSADISPVWLVVEEFRQRQQKVEIVGREWYDGGAYYCFIYDPLGELIAVGEDLHKHGEIKDGWNEPSAPLAICRATLKAVRGTQEQRF